MNNKKIMVLTVLGSVLFLSLILIFIFVVLNIKNKSINNINFSEFINISHNDSLFNDYKIRADIYLDQPQFKTSPLNGSILSYCARKAYDSTGIIVPVELVLAQAQIESGMGIYGRSPITNPFNLGEYESRTVMRFKTTYEGVQEYYYIMCNDYLKCRNIDQLFVNFKNCSGYNYATDRYPLIIKGQYRYINKWINDRLSLTN